MQRILAGGVVLAIAAIGSWSLAQSPAPDGRPGWTGATEPEEVIEARRVLMIELEQQMRPIDRFAIGEPADLATVRATASTIEAMLLAFPHLFPPTTNLYEPDVLEPPTRALPEIWQAFDSFLALSARSEAAAAAMAEANGADALRMAAGELRETCDACHAAFARPYTPPQVTDDDLQFDFDAFFDAVEQP